jgi:hypothetical protein
MRSAIVELEQGNPVPIVYEKTVDEIRANDIFVWFDEYGARFGWERSFDLDEMQGAANNGEVCIIVGRRKDLSRAGHICPVVPETDDHHAQRQGARVIAPLQSQAGSNNFKYRTSTWFTGDQFRAYAFWRNPSWSQQD